METGCKRILGFDPGSVVCGFAIIDCPSKSVNLARTRIVDIGVIRTKTGNSFLERIRSLHLAAKEVVDKWKPQVCVLEDSFFSVNPRSALKLGQAKGALIGAVAASGAELYELSPARIKRMVAGQGGADKDLVAKSLEARLGFNSQGIPLDATDALAAAVCYYLEHPLILNSGGGLKVETSSSRGEV